MSNKEHLEIIVVDNGSPQTTRDVLLKHSGIIDHLVLLNKNYGKPYAWNLGARIACENCKALEKVAPDYFLFCDSDLMFRDGWQSTMLNTYEEHKKLPLCGLSGLSWEGHRKNLDIPDKSRNQINRVRFIPGCCVMMSKEAFEKNGLWDTKRLIRTVDTSYYRAVAHRGYINAEVHPDSCIDHTGAEQRTWHNHTGVPKLFP